MFLFFVEPGGQSVTFSSSAGQMSEVCIYQHCCSASNAARPIRNKSGNSSFYASWPTPKPHLSFPAESLPEESPKVISSPVSTTGLHLLVRTGPTQTHISECHCHTLLNDKLAITSADTLQHRCDPRGQWRDSFTLPNAELKCKTVSFSDKQLHLCFG